MKRNFKLIKKDVDVAPFLKELSFYLRKKPWDTRRSQLNKAQENTENIFLRIVTLPEGVLADDLKTTADYEEHTLYIPNYPYFQKLYGFLEDFAKEIGGELCTTMIVNLLPHTKVHSHIDFGEYAKKRDRYHLVLKTEGSRNTCGDEDQVYNIGELWWFDNKLPHTAWNDGDTDRIHVIFDILPNTKPSFTKKNKEFFLKKYAIYKFNSSTD